MLMDFLFHDWQGTLVLVVAGLAGVAALIYIPAPLKHYVVVACLLGAFSAKIYSLGCTNTEDKWEAKFKATLAQINLDNERAVLAAVTKAKADTEANLNAVHKAMDEQAAAAAAAEAEFQSKLAAIAAAGDAADHEAPPLILKAIRGGR